MSELYFAYGSNLNSADFKGWCVENEREYPLCKFANAFIPDMRIVFNYNSSKRGGGVLNIRNQFGNAVPGALFRVEGGNKGWETLDKKELAPTVHHKLKVTALTEDGQAHDAETFLVSASMTEGLFVPPPTAGYVKIVEQGYAEQGLDEISGPVFKEIAAGKEPLWCINYLFVYGTFMRGQFRNHLLHSTEVINFAELANALVELYDTGKGYPAMAPTREAESKVAGELFVLKNPRTAFEILDIVEDFQGYVSQKSVYRRAVIRVRTQSERSIPAWVYARRIGGSNDFDHIRRLA